MSNTKDYNKIHNITGNDNSMSLSPNMDIPTDSLYPEVEADMQHALQQANEAGNPKKFFKDATYEIDFTDLMIIKKVCYKLSPSSIDAILIELKNKTLQEFYKGKYLLQVWEKGVGKHYEKAINHEPLAWSLYDRQFTFKLFPIEDNNEYWLYYVTLNDIYYSDTKTEEIKIRDYSENHDFLYFHFSSKRGWMMYASKREIYNLQFTDLEEYGLDLKKLKASGKSIYWVELEQHLSFLGFKNDYEFLIEDQENNLNYCSPSYRSDGKEYTYQIYFQSEFSKVPRSDKYDPIRKIISYQKSWYQIIDIVIRSKSCQIELYLNKEKIFSSSISKIRYEFQDIGINSQFIYFQTMNDQVFQIPIDSVKKIELLPSKITTMINSSNWHKITQDYIKETVNLFQDYRMLDNILYTVYENILIKQDLLKRNSPFQLLFLKDNIQQILEKHPDENSLFCIIKDKQELPRSQWGIGLKPAEEVKEGDSQIKVEEVKAVDPPKPPPDFTTYIQLNLENGEVVNTFKIPGKIITQLALRLFTLTNRLYYNYYFMTQIDAENKGLFILNFGYASQMNCLEDQAKARHEPFNSTDFMFISYIQPPSYDPSFGSYAFINTKDKTIIGKQYYHSEYPYGYDSNTFKLEKLQSDLSITDIHTIAEIKDYTYSHLLIISNYGIWVMNKTTEEIEKKLSCENLTPGNFEIVQAKYLYYQDKDGIKLLNLKTLITNAVDCTESVILSYTQLINNQVCHSMYERFSYYVDTLALRLQPLAHKNQIIPFGFDKKFQEKEIYNVKILEINNHSYSKLIAFDCDRNLITWEYPTGKYLGKKLAHCKFLTPEDKIYLHTDLHLVRDHHSRILFHSELKKEVTKVEDPLTTITQDQVQQNQQEKTRSIVYEFKIVEMEGPNDVKFVQRFNHIIEPGDKLHFSQDLTKMLHILINGSAFKEANMYELRIGGPVLMRTIQQFPYVEYNNLPFNYLFSPDLMHYLDYDMLTSEFKIEKSIKGLYQGGQSDIVLSGLFDQDSDDFDSAVVFRNIKWESPTLLRIFNSEGIEKLIDISSGQAKEKGTTVIPMYNKLSTNSSFYYELQCNSIKNNFQRMLRKFQQMHSAKTIGLTANQQKPYLKEFDCIFQRSGGGGDVFDLYIQSTYSYYHWKLAQYLIKKNQEVNIDYLNCEELEVFLLNIFPGNNSFLHKAFDINDKKKLDQSEESKIEEVKTTFNNRILKKIFKVLYDDKANNDFFFPFFQNAKGQTPFDLCIENNINAADLFLKYLKYQPLCTHSRYIINVLPKLISMNLSVGDYLDSRLLQTTLIKKQNSIFNFNPIARRNYEIKSCDLWPNVSHFKDQFLEDPLQQKRPNCCQRFANFFCSTKKNLTELDVKVEILDVPYIHSTDSVQAKISEQFFKAISDVDGYDLFKYKSVQYIIDYRWQSIRNFTVGFLLLPFFLYFCAFIAYSNVFNGQLEMEDPDTEKGFLALSGILFFFSLYFLCNEFAQLFQNKMDYFTDSLIWNLLDICPSILILTIVSARLRRRYQFEGYEDSSFLDTVHALASILMWLKFMYFLRLFEATGYLIRIVISMVWDMKTFIFILFIVEIGFGEAFLRLSEKSGEDNQFLDNYAMAFIYAFRLTLGDNDTEAYETIAQPVTAWILFVCCEVFTNIVMLNLLVTIIGQSFETINDNARLANFKERAKLIYENSYLTKFCRCCCQNKQLQKKEFLMIIQDISNLDLSENSDQMKEIQDNVKTLVTENTNMKTQITELEKLISKQGTDLTAKLTEIVAQLDVKIEKVNTTTEEKSKDLTEKMAPLISNIQKLVDRSK